MGQEVYRGVWEGHVDITLDVMGKGEWVFGRGWVRGSHRVLGRGRDLERLGCRPGGVRCSEGGEVGGHTPVGSLTTISTFSIPVALPGEHILSGNRG